MMRNAEVTPRERLKIGVKRVLGFACTAVGGFGVVRAFAKPGVTIVAYHRIIDDAHAGVRPYISVTKGALHRHIRFFRKHYTVISLEEAIERLTTNGIDRHYLVITFDDGYRDNHDLGLELFAREGVRPAIFVATDCVEQEKELWPDTVRRLVYSATLATPIALDRPRVVVAEALASRVRTAMAIIAHVKAMTGDERAAYLAQLEKRLGAPAGNDRLMLSWAEIASLRRHGATIGSHTQSHTVLAHVDASTAAAEIAGSKRILEERTGTRVSYFAYPNGTAADFDDATIAALKQAGYSAAVTTIRGVNRSGADLYRLRRTGIYLTDTLGVIKLKLAAESLLRN
jgi:peptidoglycan/xylan/chitin deacetylase (PgdA/CDA1 family)